jgi:hypothetical protein
MFNADGGGRKIPEHLKTQVRRRIEAYAKRHYRGRYLRLDIRFHGPFCYVDALVEAETGGGTIGGETAKERRERLRNTPLHLCRLRHFSADRWSCGFFAYSSEKYEFCVARGARDCFCTPEQCFATAADPYLGRQ